MTKKRRVYVKHFCIAPGGGYRVFGPHSGEEFKEDYIAPIIQDAIEKEEAIDLYLDGVYGYPVSFVREGFGDLQSIFPNTNLKAMINIITDTHERVKEEIYNYFE